MHQSELRIAVSNTGPLISAFQCGRLDIVWQFYDVIHIPASVLVELAAHGAGSEVDELVRLGLVVVHDDLTEEERTEATAIAEAIARSSLSRNKNPAHHHSEAEAVALMRRKELGAIELLLDENAARTAAEAYGVQKIGFPGILIRACRQGVISPEAVREALLDCRRQGTYYGLTFIERIYDQLREGVE